MMRPLGFTPGEIGELVRQGLEDSVNTVVPWFYRAMPHYYYRTHAKEEQVRHLNGIISGQVTTEGQTLMLRSPCRTRITYISPGGDISELAAVLKKHARDNIQTARLYSSLDDVLRLDTLLLAGQEQADPESEGFGSALEQMREEGRIDAESEPGFRAFLSRATQDYVDKFDPERAARNFRLALLVGSGEDVNIGLEPLPQQNESRLTVSLADPPGSSLLLQFIKILIREKVDVRRGYADVFAPGGGFSEQALLSFYVRADGGILTEESPVWPRLKQELELAKWFAPHDLEIFADKEGWPLKRVMLLQAACEFAHQILIKKNLWAYTSDNIVRAVLADSKTASRLMDYFETRFDPNRPDRVEAANVLERELAQTIADIGDEAAREIFVCILNFFNNTLRSNYFLEGIKGLSFRLDPVVFRSRKTNEGEGEKPYAVFFFHGPYFLGFHVRYRETARGGLRLVPARTQEQFELESNRLFDECTGLALAQQYKNKDIPEGGAKGVLLLGPEADMNLCVKSMVNSLLDVILPGRTVGRTGPCLPGIVDRLGKEEVVYLGPDENITPEHIVWIVDRARERSYPWPSTFMSSKPGAGINHKEYGVTSLGVIVFAVEILQALGIDPKARPFSVKMTGGPRGDVAGNAMKILMRDFGEKARITAVTDGRGAAYDPKGLDHSELSRLIDSQLGICEFDPALIRSEEGFVIRADQPDKVRIRNSLHNTARADIFIPAGGRPDTMNLSNWEEFLDGEGRPTARAIVEGANIFITQQARDKLEEKGVLIVHGSSANKTGVICSSYEILAGLVMSEEEFLQVKERYVAEVLAIIRRRAASEARLMLREYKEHGGRIPLTRISMTLSKEINSMADRFYDILVRDHPSIGTDPELLELVMSYCPPVLAESFGERILKNAPLRHLYALAAAFASSRMVYAEGVGWLRRLSSLKELDQVVRTYLRQEKKLAAHLAGLGQSGLADRDEISGILDGSGRKFMTMRALGLE